MNGTSLKLDSATSHLGDTLAQAWGVSKEEAVRRAVAQAQAVSVAPGHHGRLGVQGIAAMGGFDS